MTSQAVIASLARVLYLGAAKQKPFSTRDSLTRAPRVLAFSCDAHRSFDDESEGNRVRMNNNMELARRKAKRDPGPRRQPSVADARHSPAAHHGKSVPSASFWLPRADRMGHVAGHNFELETQNKSPTSSRRSFSAPEL